MEPSYEIVQPRANYPEREFGKLFTIMLVDPDAPDPANPTMREW